MDVQVQIHAAIDAHEVATTFAGSVHSFVFKLNLTLITPVLTHRCTIAKGLQLIYWS